MLRRFTIQTCNGCYSRYSVLTLGENGYRAQQVIAKNHQKTTNTVPCSHLLRRTFSSQEPPKDSSSSKKGNEIVLTPGQKVVAGGKSILYLSMLGFAGVCAFYIGKELLPTKMSPNTVFNNATEKLKSNNMIKQRFGDRIKTYGRDHGGTREGRRNFIEHTEYVDEETGSKRTRVRFNLEGPNGNAFVFAEVSNDMPSGEFVYLLVQDKRTGYVITIEDNRTKIAMERMVGGDSKGKEALGNLLGTGATRK
jgi:mitochondrial import inner membrane translocase subunit TIM21